MLNLEILRRATHGITIIRGVSFNPQKPGLERGVTLTPGDLFSVTKITEQGRRANVELAILSDKPAIAGETKNRILSSLVPGVYQNIEPYRIVPHLLPEKYLEKWPVLDPVNREAFNRLALIHEKNELGKHPGKHGIRGHNSMRPWLVDFNNIIALIDTELNGAAYALLLTRLEDLEYFSTHLIDVADRAEVGIRRLSRHAIKRIQEIYDRAIKKGCAEAGVDSDKIALR